jgi:uncharacterized protein YqgQ
MKIYKTGFYFLIVFLLSNTINAQLTSEDFSERYNNYDIINNNTPGKVKETIHTFFAGNEYKFELFNGKLSELYVDEIRIDKEKYASYEAVINKIREQITKDKQETNWDQADAKLDQVQGLKDQGQPKDDQIQVHYDQPVSKLDREKANADPDMMSSMIADLIKDGIVPDQKSLFSVTLSSIVMTVNDKKQSNSIYERYKEKYRTWAASDFSYGGSQQSYNGIHFRRRSD